MVDLWALRKELGLNLAPHLGAVLAVDMGAEEARDITHALEFTERTLAVQTFTQTAGLEVSGKGVSTSGDYSREVASQEVLLDHYLEMSREDIEQHFRRIGLNIRSYVTENQATETLTIRREDMTHLNDVRKELGLELAARLRTELATGMDDQDIFQCIGSLEHAEKALALQAFAVANGLEMGKMQATSTEMEYAKQLEAQEVLLKQELGMDSGALNKHFRAAQRNIETYVSRNRRMQR